MGDINWASYPRVAESRHARGWLQMQHHLRLASRSIEAYGRSLEDYLTFCERRGVEPDYAGRDHLALYVHDLASRPNPRYAEILNIDSGAGLANATIQLRVTAVRLYYDHLIENGLRSDNPVGRGRYTPGKAFAGKRDRGLVRHFRRLPWIPDDDQWQAVLGTLREEPLRNRLMLLLAYDGALRREELVSLEIEDLDLPRRLIRLRAETAKNSAARVLTYSETTGRLLVTYLPHRRSLSAAAGRLFLSESRRNPSQPLSVDMWSKIVQRVADRAGLPRFTTHTLRHLRLTHLARAGLDIHEIATYAGHRNLQTTTLYIHLSGVELAGKVSRCLPGMDCQVAEVFD